MSHLYRNYLRLLEKWPIDETKIGRDLGVFIRDQVKTKFAIGGVLNKNIDEQNCTKTFEVLQRLTDNHYRQRFSRRDFSATGLSAQQCKAVLSDDFLHFLRENDKGLIEKFF